jgi:Regulator of chromosome condensation (RCC1) repeat
MRSWPLALCGIASCGWIAGLGSYTSSIDAGNVDASGVIDAPTDGCTINFGSNNQCPTSLTAGVGETCVLAPDGMYCWGQNLVDTTDTSSTPVKIELSELPVSVQLSSSADPSSTRSVGCYLRPTGVLTCWGDSAWGQVQQIQSDVIGGSDMSPPGITAYAVGADHVCATSSGHVSIVCWGRSDEDELNSTVGVECDPGFCSTTFVETNNIQTQGALVAGAAHTCVAWNSLEMPDDISCWGENVKGQLGGASGATYDTVEQVASTNGTEALGSASELALGASHTCAIVDGATYCWGANDRGQLGVAGESSSTPAVLTTAPTFEHIAAGTNTTCGIAGSDGSVWCWGDNTQGQAGQGPGSVGTMAPAVPQPTLVGGIANATMIAVGDLHACAALADGDIMCWGDNQFGELGDGQDVHSACSFGDCSPTPVRVTKP